MTGLLKLLRRAEIFSLTSFAGGLEITISTFTLLSFSMASIISIMVMPPTAVDKSLPPVPMALFTPSPRRSMMVVSSWIPVPDAPMIPMEPGATLFVNAIGTLWIIPVPQSGPITESPFSCAFFFNATSSSSVTLSLNMKTFMPSSSARSASSAAYMPGMEMTARLASGSFSSALSQDFTLSSCLPALTVDCFLKNSSAVSIIWSRRLSSSTSATTTMSLAVASISSCVSSPLCLKISLFAGVAIMIDAFFTPSSAEIWLVKSIRTTESW